MKLSIITINFNNLEGLKKTAESVINQTWKEFEWIIIDGGSTDGSKEYIVKLNDDLTRNGWNPIAFWCSEPDKGIYNAMNKGIGKAKGEYLNFMNSGDCFACEETLGGVFFKDRTADILYGFVMLGHLNGRFHWYRTLKNQFYWYDLFYDSLPHQAAFIKRSMFAKAGMYDEQLRIISDWKWFITAILYNQASYEFIPYKVAIMQEGGISQTVDMESEVITIRTDLFPDFLTEEDTMNLYKMSIINSFRLTRYLFRIVVSLAVQMLSVRKKILSHRLSADF